MLLLYQVCRLTMSSISSTSITHKFPRKYNKTKGDRPENESTSIDVDVADSALPEKHGSNNSPGRTRQKEKTIPHIFKTPKNRLQRWGFWTNFENAFFHFFFLLFVSPLV